MYSAIASLSRWSSRSIISMTLLSLAQGKSVLTGLVILTSIQMVNGQDMCGTIGKSLNKQSPHRSMDFFLDTQHPANCNGNINSVEYCYYTNSLNSTAIEYSSVLAVYRPTQTASSLIYNETQTIIVTRNGTDFTLTEDEQFICSNVLLQMPVAVLVGDVLGACVVSDSHHNSLPIVGMTTDNGSSYLMTAGSYVCGNSTVPSTVVNNSLSQTDDLVLHLHANISPSSGATNGVGVAVAVVVVFTVVVVMLTVTITAILCWRCTKRQKIKRSSSTDQFLSGFDDVGYGSYLDGNQSPDSEGPSNSGQYDDIVTQRATRFYQSPEDSGQYDDVVTRRSHWIYQSPEVSYSCSPSQQRARVPKQSHREVHKPAQVPQPQLTDSQEMDSLCPHVYEFEYSRSLGRSFESSSVEMDQYKVVESDYISPIDSATTKINQLLEMNKEEDIYSKVNPYETPASKESEIYSQFKSWGVATIPSKDLEVRAHLGSGEFGSVEQGVWTNVYNQTVQVAIKTLKEDCSSSDKLKFLQEAAIMAQFRHPNVIMLYGVVTDTQPIMLVVELSKQGDLSNYLHSIRPNPGEIIAGETMVTLLQFSQQVALGMQYLSAKGFVHRDLAARNVLLSKKNVCKVADFGMSRDLADENYYVSKGRDKIPVKWTAPEALHYKKYSTASDVWSYGCLLYEIWSVGYKPFETKRNLQVVKLLDSGRRLSPPPGCPRMIYELMILCWHPETSLRPKFRDIVLMLVGSEQVILNIPEEDSSTNPLAGVLGAPLEAGENMYTDLQKRYAV